MKALEINHLKKTYKNGFEALQGIDLAVDEGDFFALLGPNGAGKSTTIGIITSLVTRTAGSVKIFGLDSITHSAEVKARLGVVPQEVNFSLFETCLNILLNQAGYYGIDRKTALGRAERYLRQLGLWERRNSISRNLSGGLKRRLMIARALVHEPKLLLLDEPTAGVDVELRRSTWDFLKEINRNGTTIVLTTHYLEEAESLCEKIAIIDKGSIVEYGHKKDLLAQLHSETFVLDLVNPLEQLPEMPSLDIRQVDPMTLEVVINRAQDANAVFKILSEHKIIVRSLRNKANRLEQLFIRLLDDNGANHDG
ncbi:MAG: ABC transporter ATP-binding protein [Gammaproteobacteria bacterium]|nr:ABC transporter ATP-binding protein [Gammaproteobacteria bacterium]MCY4210849.1 ABC transporter ATP-binding protein [Gammaproteobacteria bacterium]MCY4337309.1 ABC transporter ATP-binding protein [Gammaproteobacteria bacterium]